MPVKRRTSKHRGAVKDFEAAWLEGDRKAGFLYSLNHDFVHQELWDRCGDHEKMYWEPGMRYPEPLEPDADESYRWQFDEPRPTKNAFHFVETPI